MRTYRGETLLEPEDLPFPDLLYLITEDTSRFQEAHNILRAFGLIPLKMYETARSIEDKVKFSLPWQEENCCIKSIPGRENIGVNSTWDNLRWGLYRAVFRFDARSKRVDDTVPQIQFKYFLQHLPEKHLQDLVINENPMRPVVKAVYDLIEPVRVLDFIGNEIDFPYLD